VDERPEANLDAWNLMAGIYAASREYRLAEFKAGENVLSDRAARGRPTFAASRCSICNAIRLDTVMGAGWVRTSPGSIFSDQAIALARSISAELKIPARFLHSKHLRRTGALDEIRYRVHVVRGLVLAPRPHAMAEIANAFA